MVLSRATIEGGPESRQAPGGGGIFISLNRRKWLQYGINIQYSCFMLLGPGYVNM